MARPGKIGLVALFLLAAGLLLGPRPDTAEAMTFEASTLEPDLDAHLAESGPVETIVEWVHNLFNQSA